MKNHNRITSAIDLSEIMYAHALRLTNDKHLAEKLIQETMLQTREKAATYIAGMPFVTWIKMIMENTYLATFKDADLQQLHRLCFCGSTNLFAINYHDTYSTKEIYFAMSRLTPGQAAAVTLRLKGYKPNEIARKMRITTQRAEKHLAEATHNLIHTMDN